MSARLTAAVARWEFRLQIRGVGFWLASLAGSAAVANLVRHGSDGPPVIAYGLAQWALPVIPLLLLPALGSVRRRDEAAGVDELIRSRPVGALAYLLGKFAAGWAALGAAWLISLAVGAAAVAAVNPGALATWPEVVWRGALLVLPAFACITALCLAADAAWGRMGAVLAAGTFIILASLFYVAEIWGVQLLPLFIPRNPSPVFGYDPFTGALLTSRGWSLALTAALLAAAAWRLPRRTALLGGPGTRWAVAALLVAAVAGGAAAVRALEPVPAPIRWREAAREWEMAQVAAAVSGAATAGRYWTHQRLTVESQPVEIWTARGAEGAAAPLARHGAALLPYFPELRPPEGEPFRLVQGSYLHTPRLEAGALVVDTKAVRQASGEQGLRSLLRAMAEARWGGLAGLPARLPTDPVPFSLADSWAYAPALYQQWVVLEQAAGPEALAQEQAHWRAGQKTLGDQHRDSVDQLFASGAVGTTVAYSGAQRALVLWDPGQREGHEAVLTALTAAAAEMAPFQVEVSRTDDPGISGWIFRISPEEERYWAAVSDALGTKLTALPGWPQEGPPGPGPTGR